MINGKSHGPYLTGHNYFRANGTETLYETAQFQSIDLET